MAADEQPGRGEKHLLFYRGGVPARVTADMRHQRVHLLASPAQHFRKQAADIISVDISEHAFKRFKRAKLFSKRRCSKIARMPDFIAALKMPENVFVKIMMCIR